MFLSVCIYTRLFLYLYGCVSGGAYMCVCVLCLCADPVESVQNWARVQVDVWTQECMYIPLRTGTIACMLPFVRLGKELPGVTRRRRSQRNSIRSCQSICTCEYVCMYVCMHACMHACMHVCMYVCMYLCMYAYMYVGR